MSVSDYQDRIVDLLAYQGITSGQRRLLLPVLVSSAGSFLVTGIAKLAQRFLIILLTEQGSLTYLPGVGTTFITDGRRGFWRSAADVQQSFMSAMLDVRRQIRGAEIDSDPTDERFALATITQLTITGDRVNLQITLESQAGRRRKFIVPINVSLQGG